MTADDGSLDFIGLDREPRTDTWLSNRAEVDVGTDPWDPDHDDDGLTDGQEIRWLTTVVEFESPAGPGPTVDRLVIDRGAVLSTNATLPDTDKDGWWDGWIGVYDVGRTDNVVLYMEHLRDEDPGIQGDEIVSEQVETHTWNGEEHSKLHLGELHWKHFDDTQPGNPSDPTVTPDPTLAVEVDWIEGHNPHNVTQSSETVLEATRRNYALYGIGVRFGTRNQDRITKAELARIPKARTTSMSGPTFVTPDSMNAYELNLVRRAYHDDRSKLHLLFANTYNNTEDPIFHPHDDFIRTSTPLGLAGHTGSPGQLAIFENGLLSVPYGVVMMENETGGFSGTRKVLTHEIGHALGAGWLDDKGPGKIAECYSGLNCHGISRVGITVGKGDDPTRELVSRPSGRTGIWSVMTRGFNAERFGGQLAFSIEEASTIDTTDIPSKDD